MTGTIETVEIADKWLYSVLSADSTLAGMVGTRISGTLSDQVLTPPYVHFSLEPPAVNITGIGGQIITVDCLYLAKVVGRTASWGAILPIAKRIKTLLHRPGAVMQVATVGSLSCVHERVVQYAEVDGGTQYRHLGGIYRIRASADD